MDIDLKRFSLGGMMQAQTAASGLLEAVQDGLPAGAPPAACVAAAMMACRNAGVKFAGGMHPREDMELAASLLVSLTLGIAERLHAQPELAIIGRAALRDGAFDKIVSAAMDALATIPEDVNVTRPAPCRRPAPRG